MEITIHSLDELKQLVSVLSPDYLRAANAGLVELQVVQLRPDPARETALRELLAEHRHRDSEATKVQVTATVAEPAGLPYVERGLCETLDVLVDRDADGALYDTRWHSEPQKLTDKGVFRARRGRDNDAYKAWLLEQAVEVAEAAVAADEADPVATETHALPQDEYLREAVERDAQKAEVDSDNRDESRAGPASAVDLEALIAASQAAAPDASDSHVDLLNACRDFTTKYGHPAFTALKAAVAPDGDSGQGKTVQHLTPSERRLMQACIANYPG